MREGGEAQGRSVFSGLADYVTRPRAPLVLAQTGFHVCLNFLIELHVEVKSH